MSNAKKSSPATSIPTEAKSASKALSPKTVQPKSKTVTASPGKTRPGKSVTKKAAAKHPVTKAPAFPKVAKKAVKAKKPKLVRDSFTIPKAEFAVIEELKQRAEKLARPVKKSELIRAGIKALSALSNVAFLAALNQVPTIKTGRPALQ